ncbi:WD40 repeat domain-containing protein [Parapedobacter sp. SGR-10]|uniref:WD40 repeat domain-containing protein n=1 Tax=Parapedobacter sp. SGR-10 TaxID=2710879 RepID=UPI0013D6C952|nr:WD40 repeat domain-containing protein [Parapedobacter sp. SGR-10]NGF57881.1 WD40 repeat domain-containing protein [Parapedobacter sp. SGR-10]
MVDLELIHTLTGHQNPIYTLESNADAGVLYSAGNDRGVVEWDWETLKFRRILCTVPSSVYALYAIPDTDLLAIGMRSGDIFVVDTVQQVLKVKLKVEAGAVFCIKSLKAKQELIAVGEDGRAYIWSLNSFELLYTFKISDTTVRIIAIDAQEKCMAFGDKGGHIYLVQTEDYHQVAAKQVHEKSVTSLCFMADSLWSGGRDAQLYRFSYPGLEMQANIIPHMFTVYGIMELGDSPLFSTVSRDKTIKVWNKDLKLQKNVSRDKGVDSHYLSINTQAYNSRLGLLATAGDDKMIKVWKVSLD